MSEKIIVKLFYKLKNKLLALLINKIMSLEKWVFSPAQWEKIFDPTFA